MSDDNGDLQCDDLDDVDMEAEDLLIADLGDKDNAGSE